MKITLIVHSGGGITWELDGNQLGTTTGQVVPGAGFPLKGGTLPNQPHLDSGTVRSFIDHLSDEELLDCLGPSWAAITGQRERAA